ncbi:MAG: chloride channel protein [Flavobacterium sp.]
MRFINSFQNQFPTLKKVIIASLLIGFLASFLAISLKRITEHFEAILFLKANLNKVYFFLFPLIGLTVIYYLRYYLFKNKENKGIKEILESISSPSKNLPLYKIPSHFINGLLTVIFGGSTGIEVSTVVASATIGSIAQQKSGLLKQYQTEFICAGVAAGITALFCSPVAGILFTLEVISRKVNKILVLTTLLAVGVSSGLIYFLNEPTLFSISITTWHVYAIPYIILLGILAGVNSVFLTKSVLFIKTKFSKIENSFNKIGIATLLLGTTICFFPNLYGDGYHGIKEIFTHPNTTFSLTFFISIIGILILKPILTSITLASGGDGGVFAPSIVIGAFLGLFVATFVNTFLNANVIPINFIIIGMAALLSASIHAPFTALFLVCGITNDYTLFFPILMVCLVSKYTAKLIYPYTVYSYSLQLVKS